jgi:hypothetical protein
MASTQVSRAMLSSAEQYLALNKRNMQNLSEDAIHNASAKDVLGSDEHINLQIASAEQKRALKTNTRQIGEQ